MTFDLSQLDVQTPAEAGKPMPLFKPGTREPILNDVDAPITITLRGRLSKSASAADRVNQLARLERQKKQVVLNSVELLDAADDETTNILVACTADWTFDQLDGAPFPYTPSNAEKLWTDSRFKKIREQALAFISDDSAFLAS